MLDVLFLFLGCYFIGSIPWSYFTGNIMSDLSRQDYGPGCISPSKLLHLSGSNTMLLACLGEWAKGAMAGYFCFNLATNQNDWTLLGASLFLFAGQCFSPFIGWRGGSIYWTFLGFIMFWSPWLSQLYLAFGFTGLLLTRSPKRASIIASAAVFSLAVLYSFPYWLRLLPAVIAFSTLYDVFIRSAHDIRPLKI